MSDIENLRDQNAEYWDGRASSYSDVNKWELSGESRGLWKSVIAECINAHFAGRDPAEISILDVGCGPGFLAVIMTELGYKVTAVDMSEEMLAEAGRNAEDLAESIRFIRMDAESLDIADGSFDVVISRNLTWNLMHPDTAYAEWCRVIRPGGLLINFDSNWYHYLYDEEKRAGYEEDRARSKELQLDDQNVGESFDVMEDIAREMPLSRIDRPSWDLTVLSGMGMKAEADTSVWQKVWTGQEKVNFASTPMFMITAVRK